MADLGHGKDLKFTKTIDPSTPIEYSSAASIVNDNQLAPKIYVDTHAGSAVGVYKDLSSQIVSGGETSFTLDSTPVNIGSAQLFLEGQKRYYGASNDFTISGTTLTWNNSPSLTIGQVFEVQYDFQTGGGPLAQDQIYYFADAGDDSNDGKSDDLPFLTYGAARAAVNNQTPAADNRFEIIRIGAGTITEDVALPIYTTLMADSLHINGTVTMAQESKIDVDHITAPNSDNGLEMFGSFGCNVKVNLIDGGTNSVGIVLNAAFMTANIGRIDMTGSGSKGYALENNSVLNIKGNSLKETIASTKITGAKTFEFILDKEVTGKTVLFNETGNIEIDAKGNKISLQDSSVGEIFTNVGAYPKWTNTPIIIARVANAQLNATGDGTPATAIFDNEIRDIGSNYNPVTGVFTCPTNGDGFYLIVSGIKLNGLAATHDQLISYINATGQTRYLAECNPGIQRRVTSNSLAYSGATIIRMVATDSAAIVVNIDESTPTAGKVVNIQVDSSLSIYFLGAN